MNGTVIKRVTSHKHLGLYLKSDLKWDDQVELMANKAKKRLSIMKILRFQLDCRTLEQMCVSHINKAHP